MKKLDAPEAAGVTAVTLDTSHFLRMDKARGCRIVCMSGVLLVTVSGEFRDFELHPSDTMVVPNNGLALIEAVRDSRLLVKAPRRSLILHALNRFRLHGLCVQNGFGADV